MASKVLEFFFDVGSPATYLAWTQIPRLIASTGAEVVYKPMLLGGVFKATGNSSPAMVPAKGMHLLTDLARFAAHYGVPFQYNSHFPINTLPLMRAIMGMQMKHPDQFLDFAGRLFNGMWVQGTNLGDPSVLAAWVGTHGYDPEQIMKLADDASVKEALKANTQEAVQRGAFGAPTFFVGDEMFFGQDRLDFVERALLAR